MTLGRDHHRLDVGLACAHWVDRSDIAIGVGDTNNHHGDADVRAKCRCLMPIHGTRAAMEPRCERRTRQDQQRTKLRGHSISTNATRRLPRCPVKGCVEDPYGNLLLRPPRFYMATLSELTKAPVAALQWAFNTQCSTRGNTKGGME